MKVMCEKIKKKESCIAVVGLGAVGLPTALVFAETGYNVIGVDIDKKLIKNLSSGTSNLKEKKLVELYQTLYKENSIEFTSELPNAVSFADIIIICVQTPITSNKKPNLKFIKKACLDISQNITNKKLIIIESTLPPRVSRDTIVPLIERTSGLKCPKDFWFSYCPERLTPSNALDEIVHYKKIVGGYEKESSEVAAALYRVITKNGVIITDCTAAEVTKLAENTYRDINIAFANELALVCEDVSIDVRDVIEMANTHPRVNIHNPGCGVGGPCLTKDPFLLISPIKGDEWNPKLILAARKRNDYMPEHTKNVVTMALTQAGVDIGNASIGVLGTAYKGGVSDARESPSRYIIEKLLELKAKISVYDPYSDETFGAKKRNTIPEAIKSADCLVILTDHNEFKNIDLSIIGRLMNHKIIIDGRGVIKPSIATKHGFSYFGVGQVPNE